VRRLLEVQAAQGALLGAEGLVVLYERGVGARAAQRLLAPGLGEPAARIAMTLGRDKQDLGQGKRRDA
jgi:hypothetical protein